MGPGYGLHEWCEVPHIFYLFFVITQITKKHKQSIQFEPIHKNLCPMTVQKSDRNQEGGNAQKLILWAPSCHPCIFYYPTPSNKNWSCRLKNPLYILSGCLGWEKWKAVVVTNASHVFAVFWWDSGIYIGLVCLFAALIYYDIKKARTDSSFL